MPAITCFPATHALWPALPSLDMPSPLGWTSLKTENQDKPLRSLRFFLLDIFVPAMRKEAYRCPPPYGGLPGAGVHSIKCSVNTEACHLSPPLPPDFSYK